ncbi:ATP-grasp domain-containing protein [Glycomyces sambucus]|uniref:ATP-grasp domain-containing protein n=1 Tax=Glycomyces sambucus TaxID=380244 RepID=UPI000B827E70|nr:ATP-grasp domain-containing protein [Glycomyces sambucus]
MVTPARPRVVLVHPRLGMPWVFDSAAEAGFDLVIVPRPGEDLTDLPAPVVDVLDLDLDDPEVAIGRLRRAFARRPFQGIATFFEAAVPFTARAAAALGLPGLPVEVARTVRDKGAMRRAWAAAGLHSPRFTTVASPRQWSAALDLRFPVVVKPANGFSSIAVSKVDDPAHLELAVVAAWDLTRRQLGGIEAVVVEEFLTGPEYAVEAMGHRGETRICTIGYKGEPQGPYFEEGCYQAPADLPADTVAAIEREVTAALAAIGVTDGPSHTELRLVDGRPYVLETGARIGGSGVSSYLTRATAGVDLVADALRTAVGAVPHSHLGPITPRGAAGNYIVPCGGQGVITAIDGLDAVAAHPDVDHVVQMLHPGDRVRPYPDFSGYPAFVLSRHAEVKDAMAFHEQLPGMVRISYAREDR